MRQLADSARIRGFLRALGAEAQVETRLYLAGGATAVLSGWRSQTIDLDLRLVPAAERLLKAIPRLADELELNVDLVSPADYLPELPGWEERSPLFAREGLLACHHYDLDAQALSKIARGHAQDIEDLRLMVAGGFVDPGALRDRLARLEPALARFPALDLPALRRWLEETLDSL
jgi:hypothetical protein